MNLKFVLVFTVFLGASSLKAYIPSLYMILNRVAENQPSYPFVLEQEIDLELEEKKQSLTEVWTFESANKIQLQVRGQIDTNESFTFTIDYSNETQAPIKTNSDKGLIPELWIYQASSDLLGRWLLDQNFTEKMSVRYDRNTQNIRLCRHNQIVHWCVGPKPSSDNDSKATVWIEQDRFNISKIRWDNQDEISLSSLKQSKKMNYFQQKTFKSGSLSAQANITKLRQSKDIKVLPSKNNLSSLAQHPNKNLIEAFYLRFR